jgi:hypothetical protein
MRDACTICRKSLLTLQSSPSAPLTAIITIQVEMAELNFDVKVPPLADLLKVLRPSPS